MSYIWLFFTLLSTFLTIYAIEKIFKTVQELQKNNATVKINRRAMTIHCLVLIVNCIVVLLQSLPISEVKEDLNSGILIIIGDALVQFAICYICITMGSSI